LWEIASFSRPEISFPPFMPRIPEALQRTNGDIFAAARHGDVLLYHPFDRFVFVSLFPVFYSTNSFNPVVSFFAQAAKDPTVVAIKVRTLCFAKFCFFFLSLSGDALSSWFQQSDCCAFAGSRSKRHRSHCSRRAERFFFRFFVPSFFLIFSKLDLMRRATLCGRKHSNLLEFTLCKSWSSLLFCSWLAFISSPSDRYGVKMLKTHAKLGLVIRREQTPGGQTLRPYCHLR
jgi:hypothetical protein